MGNYAEQLDRLLSNDLELPHKRHLTLKQMYEALSESGFEGSCQTVCIMLKNVGRNMPADRLMCSLRCSSLQVKLC